MTALEELNYTDAAAACGIKETTFRRLCKEGKGPKGRREGRTLRFLREHLAEWVEEYKENAYSANAAKTKGNGVKKSGKASTNPLD